MPAKKRAKKKTAKKKTAKKKTAKKKTAKKKTAKKKTAKRKAGWATGSKQLLFKRDSMKLEKTEISPED